MIRERLARELIKNTADRFGQLFIIVVNNKMPHSPRGEERLWGRFDISASTLPCLKKILPIW
jgi:hypothetical protein